MTPSILIANSADHTPVRKRYVWLGNNNTWDVPSEHGLGADHTMNVTYWNFYLFSPRLDDIWSRYTFRRDILSKRTDTVFCPGVPNRETLSEWQSVFSGDEGEGHYIGTDRRNQRNLHDSPRSWFVADIDGLLLNDSVLENDERLTAMFLEVLADCELDFLIRPFVLSCSSSHGLKDECMMKAHVDWKLDKPLYLSQQKELAGYINQAFEAAGYGQNVLDLQIYEPSRLLITAPPEFIDETGCSIAGPRISRVKCYRTSGIQEITVPELNLKDHEPNHVNRYVRGTNISRCDEGTRWEPGHVNVSTRNVYWRYAHKAVGDKIERRHEYAEAARSECETRIRGMPKQREADTLRRIKELNREHARMWDYALQRLGEEAGPKLTFQAFDTLEDAAAKIQAISYSCLVDGLKWQPRPTLTGMSKPRFDIIGGPPGVGKTYHMRQAIKTAQPYDDYIIDFAAPIRTLSSEIAESFILENIVPVDKVQQFHGRAYYCHEDMNERCSKVEAVGVSPRTVVCPTCPHKDNCPWPKQKLSNKTGVRIMQHAHLSTTVAALKSGSEDAADLTIIDESVVDAVGTVKFSLSLKRLEELTNKVEIRSDAGGTDWPATVDAIEARKSFLRAIEPVGAGRIPTELVSHLSAILVDFMRAERESIKETYQIRLFELSKDEAFEPEAPKALELVAIKDSAEMFYQLARAIKASIDSGMEYVVGCRLTKDGKLDMELKGDIPVALKERPIIGMDATSSDGQLERLLFSASHDVRYHNIRVRAQHVHLIQYLDRGASKTKLLTPTKRGGAYNMLQQIVAVIREEARRNKSVLVVCANQVQHRLEQSYRWTSNVNFEHYKALKGLNKYKDTPCIILIGYHQMPHYELENKAEALLIDEGQEIKRLPPNRGIPYVAQWRLYYKPDGSIGQLLVKHPQHPDPVVEMLRYQEHDAECVQGLGRCRPLQRTADNPVKIVVFGTVDTGLIINEVRYWDDNFDHEMYYQGWIEEDGIVLKPSSDLVTYAYNGVFTMLGRDKLHKAFAYQTKSEAEWKTWSFMWDGYKHKCRVHIRHEQTPEVVMRLIKKVTGKDVHGAKPADTYYARSGGKNRKKP